MLSIKLWREGMRAVNEGSINPGHSYSTGWSREEGEAIFLLGRCDFDGLSP